MKQAYLDYIKKAKENGTAFISFNCIRCNEVIETLPAPKDETWDTISSCPFCNAGFFKIVKGNEITITELPIK